ncbi:putative quorum-quenching lactonase YtnP [Sporosarcina luteola]|uniref:Putative quorum-quenching lactonase YtnP n=1 Tax=Sporosarcina luteola TaxID=582850 RepID=A0A511Z3Z6_9BACL|nr:MBL fold metallo-hydrolase [Sporosarcina luteola]GEN82168.1 putative quorum-quenching lactonase YtnP [Sporosarcina luteola]
MDTYTFHDMTLTWLDGGVNFLDGGTMFGVVPKALWSRKYEVDDDNLIELRTDPIFISYAGKNILIDSGIGKGKLSDKLKRNLGVRAETKVEESLAELGLTPDDIDIVLMTHLHNDHAAGLTCFKNDELVSTFPNAEIYASQVEWDEMRNPNIRSRNTYWKENWEPIQHQVKTFEDRVTVLPGIEMIHTGGHSDGHSVIKLTQNDETILHMGDIMPTHAHSNPLWVLAYDDYPMTSIFAKEKLMKEALPNRYRFIFYHDAVYRLVQWDETGKEITESVKLTRS